MLFFFPDLSLWLEVVYECDCYWCTVRMINLLHFLSQSLLNCHWGIEDWAAIQFCAWIKLYQTLSNGSRNLEKPSIRSSSSLFSDFQWETKPKNKVIEFSLEGAIFWKTWLHMVVWKKDIFMQVSICYTLLLIIFFIACAWLESMNYYYYCSHNNFNINFK